MENLDLESDIKRRLASTKSRGEFNRVQKQLSCRINVVSYHQIRVLAEKLNMTLTGLAEHLLEQATEIAWRAADFGELSDEDINTIKALTKAPEASRQEFFPNKAEEGNLSSPANPQSFPMPKQAERSDMIPDRFDCFNAIFGHLDRKTGRVKGVTAASLDGVVRVCCLSSKDHGAEQEIPNERYWFTIYDRHLEAIQQAPQAYVAFVCGSIDQIFLKSYLK